MKVSELIAELSRVMEGHGDLPVKTYRETGDSEIDFISVYADDGNDPTEENPGVEIYVF